MARQSPDGDEQQQSTWLFPWWNPRSWPTIVRLFVCSILLMLLPFGVRTVMLSGIPTIDEPAADVGFVIE